jgi:hypothetical protein
MGLAWSLATTSGCAFFKGSSSDNVQSNGTPPADIRSATAPAGERARPDSTYQVRPPSGSDTKGVSNQAASPAFRIPNPPTAFDRGPASNLANSGSTYPTSPNLDAMPPLIEPNRDFTSGVKLPGDYENHINHMDRNLSATPGIESKPPFEMRPTGNSANKAPDEGPQVVLITPAGSGQQLVSATAAKEPPLLAFMRLYLDKRPAEAVAQLNGYDDKRRDLLLSLLSMATGLTEGDPGKLEPKQIAVILNQLRTIAAPLLSQAPLQLGPAVIAKTIQDMGRYTVMPPDHLYSADEFVQIYVEVQNFSNVFNNGKHEIHLAGYVDFLDAENRLVPNSHIEFTENKYPVQMSYVVREFHRVYSFYTPKSLQPGKYTLRLQVKDVPTQRVATHEFNMIIGAPTRRLRD